MKLLKAVAILSFLALNACNQKPKKDTNIKQAQESLKGIWLDQQAASWYEATPIGNGRLGGMVYGGTEVDTIKLNEETLWSGEPRDIQNKHGLKDLPEIRQLLADKKTLEAQKLIDSVMLGPNNQSYLPMGDLILTHNGINSSTTTDYKRILDLNSGLVKTTYNISGVNYKKEVFASKPDDAIIVKITGDKENSVNFTAELYSLIQSETTGDSGDLILKGQAPLHAFPHYEGPKEVIYEDGKGMRFQIRLSVLESDGDITTSNDGIQINNASYATLILTAATSFNGFEKSPSVSGKDENAICNAILSKIKTKSYSDLHNNHLKDYQSLFHRVSLDFEGENRNHIPINKRVEAYTPGNDPQLIALYYQFGRYLLMSSSRPGDFAQPANLQGIWSRLMQPAWSCNWTLNCNAQINYWPVETGNLSECHIPLIELTKDLSIDGSKTAKNLYGVNGWVAHHNADIWRTTSPVGGSGLWAIYQIGSAWLCHHLWEHYEFNLDEAYLSSVYPYIKNAALFYVESMQQNKDGYFVTSPAVSFENTFKKPDGTVGWACEGPTQDIQIIRDLFENCISASQILNTDSDFAVTLKERLDKLPPMKINPNTGRLQEWYDDWEPSAPKNGQVAHGWGLVADNQISPYHSPDLAKAFEQTLEYRQPGESYNSGSWTGSFPAMFYARLGHGDKSQNVVDRHIKNAVLPNFTSHFFTKYWMIDGNLGITATIGEQLLQSHDNTIHLLPALPTAHKTGHVKGLKARGGFIIDVSWKNNNLEKATIHSLKGKPCSVMYNGSRINIELEQGAVTTLSPSDFNKE
ncbi:glycoside hydrolase family 95 protein [Aestuariivivens marinum]|uniref:glycoside hydrolase family 95 protein n=1 Tax=Aestuariivivens marinum TaxID=2913555 RepID=UPI001F55FB9C|nr:glycoside hydrolase family 95 protein [Aestuariivivens marinum]